MKFVTFAATTFALASIAVAVDDRQLVKFSPTTKNFCEKWNTHCKAYKPKHTGLTFEGTLCEAGDYKGMHKNTEARVFCSFKDSTGKIHLVTKHIAAETGAKFITA
ncbi:hypothetical protein OC846_004615 [Tilletia horrida]|uniref:Small secreted protein n=1 Tax=Tilletia horrida TaxID=155126 RepID=A0AAN6GMV5_9BASI|nr:hypothetical protein OC846_004615 [Tilletia horrida]